MITFENIKTGEKVVFTGEQEVNARNAHMAAFLNSSDMGPNSGVRGQDFGWRLAPEVIAEMEAVRQDFEALERIARRVGIGVDDIRDFHILSYVADRNFAEDAKALRSSQPDTGEMEDDYRARVKAAKSGKIEVQTNKGEKLVEYNEAAERGQKLAAENSKETKTEVKVETVEVKAEAKTPVKK